MINQNYYREYIAPKQPLREKLFQRLRAAQGIELVICANGEDDDGHIEDWSIQVSPDYAKEHPTTTRPGYTFDQTILWPALNFEATEVIMKEHLEPGITVEQAMNDFADAILEDTGKPDWVNNEGGRVEIRVDLMGAEPLVKVNYELRIMEFEPAGTFYYHGLTVMPITETTLDEASDFAILQSDWSDVEGYTIDDPIAEDDLSC